MANLDWMGIVQLQPTPSTVSTKVISLFQTMGIQVNSDGVTQAFKQATSQDLTWTDRMVDRFTLYLDGKIQELQQWFLAGLKSLGETSLMVLFQGGQLFCILWVIKLVFNLMMTSKAEEDFVSNFIFAFGGIFIFKSLEYVLIA